MPDAHASSRPDYTTGSIRRNIWRLAVPMTLDQLTGSFHLLVDAYFLGRLGSDALAAMTLGWTILFVLSSIGMGLGVAAIAVVSRRIGERNIEAASHAVWQVLMMAMAIGLIISSAGLTAARPLLVLLGASDAVTAVGARYLHAAFLFMPVLILSHVTNSVLRGAGEAKAGMVTMAVAHGLASLLAPTLILGLGPAPELGVVGSPVALGAGHTVGWLAAMALLCGGRLRLHVRWADLWLDPPLMRRMIVVGLPSSIQMVFRSSSRLVIQPIVAYFGTTALAAFGVAMRVTMFPFSVGFAMGNTAGTLVGQNLGAHQPDRAASSAWRVAVYNVTFMSVFVVGFLIFAEPIVSVFTGGEAAVIAEGAGALRILGVSYIFSAMGVVMGRALDGAGDTAPAMFINLITLWGVQIPAAYVLSRWLGLGVTGIWTGIALANMCNACLMALWFLRGGWKRKQV